MTDSRVPYKRLRLDFDTWEHPFAGNALLATDLVKGDGSDATAIVAANGGSDLIYVPDGSAETVRRIVNLLLTYDYVGAVFVDSKYGAIPGTLPLDAIGLVGANGLPHPAMAVAFKVFYLNPADLQTAIQIADTTLQEGQGMHGGIGRESTFNNMAAMGPDFKRGFVDPAPVSNADIVPTLLKLMTIPAQPHGTLKGRSIDEALIGGAESTPVKTATDRFSADECPIHCVAIPGIRRRALSGLRLPDETGDPGSPNRLRPLSPLAATGRRG